LKLLCFGQQNPIFWQRQRLLEFSALQSRRLRTVLWPDGSNVFGKAAEVKTNRRDKWIQDITYNTAQVITSHTAVVLQVADDGLYRIASFLHLPLS